MDHRSVLSTLGRVCVSVLLLWFVVSQVGVTSLVENIAGLPRQILVIAAIFSVINVGISAWQWRVLLRCKCIARSYLSILKYYYIGQLFNAFLPTAIGGDTARMYYAYTDFDADADAVSSVAVERLTGLAVIFLFGGVGAAVVADRLPNLVAGSLITVSIGGLTILSLALFTDILRSILKRTTFRLEFRRIGHRFEQVYSSIGEYRGNTRSLVKVILLSAVFRIILVVNHYLVTLDLDIEISFIYFVILILFTPVSIQGFGVREASYVYLFTGVGATAGTALTLGVIMQLILGVLNNILGGGIYVVHSVRQ
jgi:uncharacterized protein (TIRG00374 family)